MNSNQDFRKGLLQGFNFPIALPFTIKHISYRKSTVYSRDGFWNQKERLKYTVFLQYFRQILQDPCKKKAIRIFEMMSDMIVTRSPAQCRTHHQKMQKYMKNIEEIVKSVSQKYDSRIYQQMQQKYLVFIKVLLQNKQKYIRLPNPRHRKAQKQLANLLTDLPVTPTSHQLQNSPVDCNDKQLQLKGIQDYKKTTDEYLGQLGKEESQDMEQIPIIDLLSSNMQVNSQIPIERQAREQVACRIPPGQPREKFPHFESLAFTISGRQYFEEQYRLLQMKRKWHMSNVDHLNEQLMREKQAILDCDLRISFCNTLLGSR